MTQSGRRCWRNRSGEGVGGGGRRVTLKSHKSLNLPPINNSLRGKASSSPLSPLGRLLDQLKINFTPFHGVERRYPPRIELPPWFIPSSTGNLSPIQPVIAIKDVSLLPLQRFHQLPGLKTLWKQPSSWNSPINSPNVCTEPFKSWTIWKKVGVENIVPSYSYTEIIIIIIFNSLPYRLINWIITSYPRKGI